MSDPGHSHGLRHRYLELLKRSLLNELYPEMEAQLLHVVLSCSHRQPIDLRSFWDARRNGDLLNAILEVRRGGDTLVLRGLDSDGRLVDQPDLRNYSEFPHTMIGRARLDHLQYCAETLLQEGIEGDFLEAGVWRGGACALLAGILEAHEDRDKHVWLADSFRGLPPPRLRQDVGWQMSAAVLPVLAVAEKEVRSLLERYGLMSDRIRFLNGWFRDTLPSFRSRLSLLRIDADLYESTRDALEHLYENVVDKGFVIVDDYGIIEPCRHAVDEFRQRHGIVDAMHRIDAHGVFWRRGSGAG